MSYKIQKIANLRTVKALRGQSLTIDLGKTFTGTITAWMKKSPNDVIYRSFTTTDNRNLFLSKEKTQDYYDETTLELLSEVSGKWYFDVRQLPTGGTTEDEKVIFTGTILFEDNITDSTGRELIDPSVPWATNITQLSDVPSTYGTSQQLLIVKPTQDGVEWASASDIINFIGLSDTPSTWGNVGDVLRIDSSGNSLEWGTSSSQDLDSTSDVTFNSISGDGSGLTNINYNVTESDVTNHQGAISITKSQITDLTEITNNNQLVNGAGYITSSDIPEPFNQDLDTTSDVTFNSISGDGSGLTNIDKYTTTEVDDLLTPLEAKIDEEVRRGDTPQRISTMVGGPSDELVDSAKSTNGMGYGSSASLSADGSKLIVGNISADTDPIGTDDKGSMTTYAWNGSTWIFVCRTYSEASTPNDSYYGISCSLNADGTIMVVGADYYDYFDSSTSTNYVQAGAVFTYDWNDTTNSWDYRNILLSPGYGNITGPSVNARFGIGVDLDDSGTKLVVGEYYRDFLSSSLSSTYFQRDYQDAGAAYVFDISGGVWSRTQILLCEPSIMDDVIYHTTLQYWLGGLGTSTQNYFMNSRTNFPAEFQQYALPDGIMANFASMQPRFGSSVSISGDGTKIVIGMSGYGEGTTPVDLSNPTEEEYYLNLKKSQMGGAFYYEHDGTNFKYEQTITAPDRSFNDWFGTGLGISNDGKVLGVGAWTWEEGDGMDAFIRLYDGDPISDPSGIYDGYNKTRGESTGQVYLYDYNSVTNEFEVRVQFGNEDPNYFNRFGRYVALDDKGNRIAITEHKNIAVSTSAIREGKLHIYTTTGGLINYYDPFNSRGFYNQGRSIYLNDNYGNVMYSVEPTIDPIQTTPTVTQHHAGFNIPLVSHEVFKAENDIELGAVSLLAKIAELESRLDALEP